VQEGAHCTHVPVQPPAELLGGGGVVEVGGGTAAVWDRLCRLPLSGTSPQAQGTGEGDDRSRQFQNAGLGLAFPWQNTADFEESRVCAFRPCMLP
jgi:hypothetical protein